MPSFICCTPAGCVPPGYRCSSPPGRRRQRPWFPGRQTFDLPKGALFSIVGFSKLTGITLEGARYDLNDYTLPFGSSRTISNVAEGPVAVTFGSGVAVFIARPYDLSGA